MRRVRALGLADFASYCSLLKNSEDEGEIIELVNAATTNLTAFFRENHHFEYLGDEALPERMRAPGAERRINICSTGEEPYSLATTAGEIADRLRAWQVDTAATAIS